ncbi:alpha/beta hydrolase [Streptomyces sp. DT171]|uniref:alpha/beta hydrolase n=1 Tax=Streptomyces sp. DT171 TaxID=3416524 RepID=UPI003CFB8EBB
MSDVEGMDEFLDRYHEAMASDFFALSTQEQRRQYENLSNVFPYAVPADIEVRDGEVPGRDGHRFRSYRPRRPVGDGLLVYMHGGGFVVGSLDSHHTLAAELAHNTGRTVVSSEFRQAPEHPFPAAVEDCYELLRALAERPGLAGPDTVTDAPVLCGDSSGANLAVTVSMMCRDRGGVRPGGQGLISPVLDFARWWHGSDDPFGDEMAHYARSYCPDPALVEHPYVSPLVRGEFHDLPPAYIMSTELDPLQVDSERYAEHLRRHGVPVRHVMEPDLVHAPIRGRGLIPSVADAWRRFCAAVGDMT